MTKARGIYTRAVRHFSTGKSMVQSAFRHRDTPYARAVTRLSCGVSSRFLCVKLGKVSVLGKRLEEGK